MAQSILFWKGKPMLLLPSDNICQSIYCIIWTIHLEGFFFSSVNQLDPHCLFALMFHVWSMLQFILQGLALALQSVLLPAQGWLFSLLLLSSLTLIQQYKFTSVVQGSVQPVVLGVLCSSDSAYSEEQVLSAAHRATSILCVWAMCYSHWACWDPWKEQ